VMEYYPILIVLYSGILSVDDFVKEATEVTTAHCSTRYKDDVCFITDMPMQIMENKQIDACKYNDMNGCAICLR